MVGTAEVVVLVGIAHGGGQLVAGLECPAVDLEQLVIIDHILRGIKVADVAQHEAGRVAHLAVRFGQLAENFLTGADVDGVIAGSDPQTDDVSTVVADDLTGLHAVAGGLVHLLALGIDDPAVAQDLAVRGHTLGGDAGQQTGLEPAAELVGTLHIHVNGPAQLGALTADSAPGGAGVEPDVHDVGVLLPVGGTALADLGLGQDVVGIVLVPGVAALLAEQVGHSLDGGIGDMVLAALLAVEYRDGHAPDALAADAPVTAVTDHTGHAVMAPRRLPVHAVNGLVDVLLEGVDGAEPLLGSTEDDGMMAAPAMRVLVGDVLHTHQMAALLDVLQNDLVGVPDLETGKLLARLGGQAARVVHGNDNGNLRIVIDADLKVLNTMAGSGVDAARAAFQRDVVAQNDQTLAVKERMLILHELELTAENSLGQDLVLVDMAALHRGLNELAGHDVVGVTDLDEGIFQIGVQAGRDVGGQRPGGGRPDDDPCLVQRDVVLGQHAVGVVGQLEADIDGIALVLGVLNLSLGQGGAVLGAPVHGLHALVDVALLGHLPEDLDLAGLKLGAQGQVRVLKVALHAQTLELLVHDADVLGGKLLADLAQLQLGDTGLLVAEGAQRLQLDGQAVGVIAGHVGCLEAGHVLIADDDVLDDLVQGRTHVDIAVGIRRAVVQDVLRLALVVLNHLLIDMVLLPVLEHFGFLLRQTGPHFKRGLHLMDGVVVVLRQSFLLSSIYWIL